jgi:hypothetical protein
MDQFTPPFSPFHIMRIGIKYFMIENFTDDI